MFSIRMRASLEGRHVSGAERIAEGRNLGETVYELLKRPGEYDEIVLKVEMVEDVNIINSLNIREYNFRNMEESRMFVTYLLEKEGIRSSLVRKLMAEIEGGANPHGGNMRGAMIVDVETGERLEKDKSRGIRTVRVDWDRRADVKNEFLGKGLTERTVDALAIASKNIYCGVLAEICWSDDPEYVTGYVATKSLGYVRITPLKRIGDPFGGRIYFVRKEDVERVIECLERKACLVKYF